MESLESILSDLQGKYQDPDNSKQNKSEKTTPQLPSQTHSPPRSPAPNALDSLLNDLRSNSQGNKQNYAPDCQSSQVTPEVTSQELSPAIDRDLQEITNLQKAKDQEEATKTATEWLEKLDPLDGEGLWFEEFAKNYPSRLEAAIALFQSE